MTLAWFRATRPDSGRALDETASTIAGLAASHHIRVVTSAEADDFVWQNHQSPVTLCVFELNNTPDAAFIWPYLFRFPGMLITPGTSLHNARAAMLQQQARHDEYRAEFLFNEGHPPPGRHKVLPRGSWPMLRAAVMASKLTVVRHAPVAERLAAQFAGAPIRRVPLGYAPAGLPEGDRFREETQRGRPGNVVRCAVYGEGRLPVAARASARAATTRPIEIVPVDSATQPADVDVVLATTWPPGGESLMPALAGMAAGLPVVVFETEITAEWPTLDPQTWQPRGHGNLASPIAIAIDPRDEEHSLMLALKRLDADPAFSYSLAAAGHAWWTRHGNGAGNVDAWERVIAEAAAFPSPQLPPDWPAHLQADVTRQLTDILSAFGVKLDL